MSDTPGWAAPGGGEPTEPDEPDRQRPEPVAPPGGPPQQPPPPGWAPQQPPPPGWAPQQPPPPGWAPQQPPPPGWAPQQPPPAAPTPPGPPGWTPQQPPSAGWAPQQGPGGWGNAPAPGWAPGPAQWAPQRPPAPKPGIIPLRPLGVGELLDGAISALRANPRTMLTLTAVIVVVSQLIQLVLTLPAIGITEDLASVQPDSDPDEALSALGSALASLSLLYIAQFVVTFLSFHVLVGLLAPVVGRAVLSDQISVGEAWRQVRPRLLPLVGLALLLLIVSVGPALLAIGLAVLLIAAGGPLAVVGALLLVLGGLGAVVASIWAYVTLAFTTPALVLERQPVRAAIARSRQLVKGSWWRVCGILLLGLLLYFVVSSVLSTAFTLPFLFTVDFTATEPEPVSLLQIILGALGGIVSNGVTFPFGAAVVVLLYVDQRMRREGLDLELARAADTPGQPPPATGPAGPGW
jgi:hypothetical protein